MVTRDRREYTEYILDWNAKVYPGDDVELISPNGKSVLEYEFDDRIWETVDAHDVNLYWKVLFDDQMPVEGSKNFRELNVF